MPISKSIMKPTISFLLDIVLAAISLQVAHIVRFEISGMSLFHHEINATTKADTSLLILLAITWVTSFAVIEKFHKDRMSLLKTNVFLHLIASLSAIMVGAGLIFFSGKEFSRMYLGLFSIISILYFSVPRILFYLIINVKTTINTLIKNIMIPLIFLTAYSFGFAFISSRWLIEGVNYNFLSGLAKLSFFSSLVFFLSVSYIFSIKRDISSFSKSNQKPSIFRDFLLLFIPLTPVAQYLINNKDIISILDTVIVTSTVLLFGFVFILLIPFLIRTIASERIMRTISSSLLFTIINMAFLSKGFSWYEKGNLLVQIGVFSIVFFVVWFILGFQNKKYQGIIIFLFFIFSLLGQIFTVLSPKETNPDQSDEHPLLSVVRSKSPIKTPNIYLLVYESYVTNETMLSYGIDNSEQEDYLKSYGFVLYPHTYSIDAHTLGTMSRVLNASESFFGSNRRAASGDGVVHNALRHLEYGTYGIFHSDYFFRGTGSNYDFSIPETKIFNNARAILQGIAVGEFRFDLEVNVEFEKIDKNEFYDINYQILKNVQEEKVFIYSHSPHPGHSQNSGVCRSDETEQYKSGLFLANLEMRRVIQLLLEKDPFAIIVIAGDHGPYLTKNCTITGDDYDVSEITRIDIQDRYGTFLAIRWPDEGYINYDDITVIQDLFVAIFAYIFDDPSLMSNKISPMTVSINRVSGARVSNGIIEFGVNNGQPLFLFTE